jgi:hypothetical protein
MLRHKLIVQIFIFYFQIVSIHLLCLNTSTTRCNLNKNVLANIVSHFLKLTFLNKVIETRSVLILAWRKLICFSWWSTVSVNFQIPEIFVGANFHLLFSNREHTFALFSRRQKCTSYVPHSYFTIQKSILTSTKEYILPVVSFGKKSSIQCQMS